jgi:monothiol glutaredoxin
MRMQKPKIIAYLKPHCGWSQGVRAVLGKYNLPFEDRDIWNDPRQRLEMIQKSGQELSPSVEVNGQMLADISGEELEAWLIKNKIAAKDHAPVDVPINAPCADHGEVISTPITLKG